MSVSNTDLKILYSLGFQNVDAFRDIIDVIKLYLDYIECKQFDNYIIKEDIADYLKDIIRGVFNSNPDISLIYQPIDLGHPDIIHVISETIDWLLVKHDIYNEYRHRSRIEFCYEVGIHPDVKKNIIYFINIIKQKRAANNLHIDNMMNSMSLTQRPANPVAQPLNNTDLEDVFSGLRM